MNLFRQIIVLKEKNKALCDRRKSLKQWIGSMKRELERGCHDHRNVHKKLYECINESELLTTLINSNGLEITILRENLKNAKIQRTKNN